jgi:nucleotide-binding universal stress UspA family protein
MMESRRKILLPLAEPVDPQKLKGLIIGKLWLEGDEFTLFHVIESPAASSLDLEQFNRQIAKSESWLNEIGEELRRGGLDVKVKVAVARDAAEAIVEEITGGDYDMVVFLKKKRRALKRLIIRGVSEKVASSVSIPVVTLLMDSLEKFR